MSDIVNFMQTRHIDSFQKLRVLYFFHKHTESGWTSQQIAEQLFWHRPSTMGGLAGESPQQRSGGLGGRAPQR